MKKTAHIEEEVLRRVGKLQNVFIFLSKEDEIDTQQIIARLHKAKKTIIVPICQEENIVPVLYVQEQQLKKGVFGILEPVNVMPFQKNNIDIFFVPGTQFDNKGNRKGRGKGYFDRFLKEVKERRPIIGLCFDYQVSDNLIPNSWDVPVDELFVKQPSNTR